MDELTFSASVAWALPFVISLLKNRRWPAVAKVTLTVIAALGIATAGLLVSGKVDLSNGIQDVDAWLGAAAMAFAEAQIVYRIILRGTTAGAAVNDKLTNAIWSAPQEGVPLGDSASEPLADDAPPEERPLPCE